MRISEFNNLYFYFACSQFIFIPVYFYHTPFIPDEINTNKAILMHIIGMIWSALGYFTVKYYYSLPENQKWRSEDKSYSISKAFYVFSYLLILAGTVVVILQVILFVPLTEYASKLFGSDFEAELRSAYSLSSDEGGLSGIIKMFGYAPLSIYLMSVGLLNFIKLDETDKQNLKVLSWIALGAIVIKVFFSLERLTVMAIILANIFIGFKKGYIKNIRFWIFLSLILLLANYLSIKRLENVGLIDFALLYFKLGLVNYQLMIDTCSHYTFGFSTILSPLYFVLKFFHLPSPDFGSQYEWEWNPAQYFSSYAFQDFGYFFFVIFYLIGALLFIINRSTVKHNIYASSIYFTVLYGVVSFVVVPAIRSVDYWFSLIVPLLLVKQCVGYSMERKAE